MSKIEKIRKDIRKLEKLKEDIEILLNKKENELEHRIELLKQRNCITCKNKDCPIKNKKRNIDNCENYINKEYKHIYKIKM